MGLPKKKEKVIHTSERTPSQIRRWPRSKRENRGRKGKWSRGVSDKA